MHKSLFTLWNNPAAEFLMPTHWTRNGEFIVNCKKLDQDDSNVYLMIIKRLTQRDLLFELSEADYQGLEMLVVHSQNEGDFDAIFVEQAIELTARSLSHQHENIREVIQGGLELEFKAA